MAVTVYPESFINQDGSQFTKSQAYFGANSFGIPNVIATPSSATKKFIISGIRISFKFFGTESDNFGIYVFRGSSEDNTKILAHCLTHPTSIQYNFEGQGISLNANETISVAFKANSGTANFNVTVWGYEV